MIEQKHHLRPWRGVSVMQYLGNRTDLQDTGPRPPLLDQFPSKSRSRCLSGLNLAAGKLEHASAMARSQPPALEEQATWIEPNQRGDHQEARLLSSHRRKE